MVDFSMARPMAPARGYRDREDTELFSGKLRLAIIAGTTLGSWALLIALAILATRLF